MVRKITETKYTLQKEISDIEQILKYGNCSESQRNYLRKRVNELERKLREDEGVSN